MVNPVGNNGFLPPLKGSSASQGVSSLSSSSPPPVSLEHCARLPITIRQFALLHGDTFLKGDPLEGGDPRECVSYWKALLELWQREKVPIGHGLSKNEIALALQDYKDILDSSTCIDEHDLQKSAINLLEFISRRLSSNGKCALPLRVRGRMGSDPGHVFSCIFTKDDKGQIWVQLLNKGDEAELHPLAEVTETKDKRTYSFPPICLNNADLIDSNNCDGVSLFTRLLSFSFRSQSPEEAAYSSANLYEYFLLVGHVDDKREVSQTDATTSQRSGSCPMQLPKLLLRSHLSHPEEQKRRLLFAARFQSFLDVLKSNSIDFSDPQAQAVVRKSLFGFCMFTEKLSLSPEEIQVTHALIEAVEQRLKEAETALIERGPTKGLPDPKGAYSTTFTGQITSESSHNATSIIDQDIFIIHSLPADPSQFLTWLKSIPVDSSSPTKETGIYFHYIFSQLPVPTQGKDYWEGIPQEQVKEVIKELNSLAAHGIDWFQFEVIRSNKAAQETLEKGYTLWNVLLKATICAVVDKLCRRIPELQLAGWGTECNILSNIETERGFFFIDRKEKDRLRAIDSYFREQLDKSKGILWRNGIEFRNCSWDLREIRFKVDTLKDAINGRGDDLGLLDLIKYFQQFEFLSDVKAESTVHQYGQFWGEVLPQRYPEFAILQKYHLISKIALSRAGSTYVGGAIGIEYDLGRVTYYSPDKGEEYVVSLSVPPSLKKSIRGVVEPSLHELLIEDRYQISALGKQHKLGSLVSDAENGISFEEIDGKEILESYEGALAAVRGMDKMYAAYSKKLVVASVLTWMKENPHLCAKKQFFAEVMNLLLREGHLEKAARQEPLLLTALREYLDEVISKYLSNKNTTSIAFSWIYLRYLMETHLSRGCASVEETSQGLRGKLHEFLLRKDIDEQTRFKALTLRVNLMKHRASMIAEELCDIVADSIAASTLGVIVEPFYEYLQADNDLFVMRLLGKEQKWQLSDFTSFLERIGQRYGLEKGAKWEGTFPRFTSGELSIDLMRREIRKNGMKEGERWEEVINPDYLKDLVALRPPYFYDPKRRELSCTNGDVHVTAASDRLIVKQKRDGHWYTYHWYTYLDSPEIDLPTALVDTHTFWVRDDGEEILVLDKKKQIPRAIIKKVGEDKVEVYRTERSGHLTDEKLVRDPPPAFFAPLDKFNNEFLVWKGPAGLTSFTWVKYGITFKVKEGRYYYSELSDYYLAPVQKVQGLPLISTALVLQNEEGDQKVLLPAKFIRGEFIRGGGPLIYEEENGCTLLYSLNKKRGRIEGTSAVADLYLMALYVMEERYEEAKEILDHLNPLSRYGGKEWCVLEHLLDLCKQPEPNRSAFCLKLALHVIDVENKRLQLGRKEEKYDDTLERMRDGNFWEPIRDHYSFYLSSLSSKEINRVFRDLRLSVADRKKLIRYLEKFLFSKSTWIKEYTLLNRGEYTISPYNQPAVSKLEDKDEWVELLRELLLRKPLYSSELPHHPIRFAKREIGKLFPYLYKTFWHSPPGSLSTAFDLVALRQSGFANTFVERILYWVAQQEPSAELPLLPESLFNDELIIKKSEEIKEFLSILEQKVGGAPISQPILRLPSRELSCRLAEERTLLQENIVQIKALPPCGDVKKPLANLSDTFFTVEEKEPSVEGGFVLSGLSATTSLEQKLLDNLTEGYASYQKRKITRYYDKGEEAISTSLQNQIKEDEKAAQTLKEEIEKLANRLNTADLQRAKVEDIRHIGHQRSRLTMESTLYRALLTQTLEALTRENPFLQEADAREIYEKMLSYMVISSRIDQAKEALRKLKKCGTDTGKIEREVAPILDKKRTFDPVAHPLLLIYEYATGMILRPEQVDLLKWIFQEKDSAKRQELLVEFQAGGGKTKVISAILAFAAVRKGKLPIFFSLPALHDITKEDLRDSFNQVFDRKVRLLELSLHSKLELQDLEAILADLKRWRQEGACLEMVPESWYALHLTLLTALKEGEGAKAAKCRAIMDFLKEEGFFIIDEAHRNVTSLWQANIATGRAESLPEDEQRLFVLCYKALTGSIETPLKLDDGRLVHEVLLLRKNQQALISKEERGQIVAKLAEFLISYYQVPEEHKAELRSYLLDAQAKKPACMQPRSRLDKRKRALLFLTRGLLTTVFDCVLTMVHLFDYGASVHADNEVEDPRYQKKPVTSQFENPDIAAALSCQGLFQRGLSENQIKNLIFDLLKQAQKSPLLTCKPEKVLQVKQFLQWQQASKGKFPMRNLLELQSPSKEELASLVLAIGKNPEVIEFYLIRHLLPQVVIFPNKVYATPVDLLYGGSETLLFSATLGLREEYPTTTPVDQKVSEHSDHPFQAAVIQRACMEHNRGCHWLDNKGPRELFEDLYAQDSALFADLAGIIDLGGWNRNHSTEEVAERFLEFAEEKRLPFDGAIYITENDHDPSAKSVMTLMLQDGNGKKRYTLRGSNLEKALREAGVENPDHLRLFKIYGPSQCTGTDLQLESNARMLLTIGETTILWPLIHAIMRARGFLLDQENPEEGQKIVWVGSHKLKEQIPEATKGPEAIFQWALRAEAQCMKRAIMARAFQGLSGEVRQAILQNPEARSVEAFTEEIDRDLEALYGGAEEIGPTADFLKRYLQSFKQRAKFKGEITKKENAIIQETEALIPKVQTEKARPADAVSLMQREQKAEQKAEKKIEQKGLNRENRSHAGLKGRKQQEYANKEYSISSDRFLKEDKMHKCANAIFDPQGKYFSPDLYFLPNAYLGVYGTEKEASTIQLKPITYFLLIYDKKQNRYTATAVSQKDATIYQKQLREGKCEDRKAALMTVMGDVAQNGCGALGFTEEEIKKIREGEWMQKILSDLNLLNGHVFDFEFLKREWSFLSLETRRALWDNIAKWQVMGDDIHREEIEELLNMGKVPTNVVAEETPAAPSQLLPVLQPPQENNTLNSRVSKQDSSCITIGRVNIVAGGILLILGGVLAAYFVFYAPIGYTIFYISSIPITSAAVASAAGGGLLFIAFASVGSYLSWKKRKV